MLTRWDPFREMLSMRRAMDRMIESLTGDNWDMVSDWNLALDVVEDDDAFTVKAALPGVSPEDIDVTFNRGMLTIKGNVKDESETNKGQYHLRERRYGTFSRTITLPSSVNAEDIQAEYKDGILSLRLPKAEEVKPKRIPVHTGSQKVIEGNSRGK